MGVKQVTNCVQIEEHTVCKLARSEKISTIKIVGQWRIIKDNPDQIDYEDLRGIIELKIGEHLKVIEGKYYE